MVVLVHDQHRSVIQDAEPRRRLELPGLLPSCSPAPQDPELLVHPPDGGGVVPDRVVPAVRGHREMQGGVVRGMCRNELAPGSEELDSGAVAHRHLVDSRVVEQRMWLLERPRPVSRSSPGAEEDPVGGESLDAASVEIEDEHVAVGRGGDVHELAEAALAEAFGPPGHGVAEAAVGRGVGGEPKGGDETEQNEDPRVDGDLLG